MTEQRGGPAGRGPERRRRRALRSRWSVRSYLIGTVATVVLVFLVGGAVLGGLTLRTSTRNVRLNATSLAGVAARAVGSSVTAATAQVTAVAASPAAAATLADPSQCLPNLRLELLPNSRIDLIRQDGDVVCSWTEEGADGTTYAGAAWLGQLLAGDPSLPVGPVPDPLTRQTAVVIGSPVLAPDGGVLGGVLLVVPTEGVADRLAEGYGGFRNYQFVIVDPRSGAVVAGPHEAEEGQSPTNLLDSTKALSGSKAIPGTTWDVVAGLPRAQALQPIRTILFRGGLVALAVMLVLLGSLAFVYHRIVRPLRQLTAATGVTGDHAALLASLDGPREINQLAEKLRGAITAHEAYEVELSNQALHDPLTGLPNRTLLEERLRHSLQQASRSKHSVAVMFLDLDRFKLINDALGHVAGDQVLVATAARLAGILRPGDTLARFGGDEFVIVGEDLADPSAAHRFAQRVVRVVEAPFEAAETLVRVTASVGVATGSGATTAMDLLRNADTAMYLAKERGGPRFEMFDAQLGHQATARLQLENELRVALDRGELRLEYQPKVDLRTGETMGVEALLRWDHPALGSVAPATFIPIAEETGLIVPLGRFVLDEACRQSAAWRQEGIDVIISVNVSARQLADAAFVEHVVSRLAETKTPPAGLCLELTESILMYDATRAALVLAQLHAIGLRLSIDDFGTGYSSLAYLYRFPVDELKIDGMFVQALTEHPDQRSLVSAMVAMGRALDLDIVAEGIETAEQASQLSALGCEMAQGYFFSRPKPPGSLGGFLKPHARVGSTPVPNST